MRVYAVRVCQAGVKALDSNLFWYTSLLTVVSMGVVDVSHLYLHRMMFPDPTYVIQERDRGYLNAEGTNNEELDGISSVPSSHLSSRHSLEGLTSLPVCTYIACKGVVAIDNMHTQ